jgi:hypothetical protein
MGRAQLTVTVPAELGQYVAERSAELGVKKSVVVSQALEADRQRQLELLFEEGYEQMATRDEEMLEEFERLDDESPWPDY